MAKKNKEKNEQAEMNQNFYDLYKSSPAEIQMMLENLSINSFEELLGLAAIMGIDLDKLEAYSQKNGENAIPSMEEIKIDGYEPSQELMNRLSDIVFHQEDGDDGEDDTSYDDFDLYTLPENPFIGDEAKEYHIRIKLSNAPVPIWRELKLPSNLSLEALSFIINDAMGWDGIHLHHFIKNNIYYKNTNELQESNNVGFFSTRSMNQDSSKFAISHLLREEKDRIKYEYDFGDSWMHEIWLKGIREYEPGEKPALTFVKGKGACPPEDCGGVWGYEDLINISKKKRKSAEDKERLEWYFLRYNFDPDELDTEMIEDNLDALWCELTEQ